MKNSCLKDIVSCPLAGKVTLLMRQLLERQVPTVHLEHLRKEDGPCSMLLNTVTLLLFVSIKFT